MLAADRPREPALDLDAVGSPAETDGGREDAKNRDEDRRSH
jgi:hypothetical protein